MSDYTNVLNSDYLANVELDDISNNYVCGYAAHSICKKISCSDCQFVFIKEKGIKIHETYFDYMQRGGLVQPTQVVQQQFFHMCAIFQEIIRNGEMKTKFFCETSQRKILHCLTLNSVQQENFYIDTNRVCNCGQTNINIFKMLLFPMANIILLNYCKEVNHNFAKVNFIKRKLNNFL